MTETPAVSLIDPRDIKEALDRIRQAEPLGDHPLKRLVWLRLRLGQEGVSPSVNALDMALSQALLGQIGENLERVRQLAGAPSPEPADLDAAMAALRSDYAQENARLEAWSALCFYYVHADFDLQWQELAQALGLDPRQLRRRTELGYRLLADAIGGMERAARVSNHQLWMRLKLPAPAYTSLFGVEETLASGRAWLLADEPPHALALIGPGGAGKTALARELAGRMVEEGHLADLAWLSLTGAAGYPALCALIARDVGLPHLLEAPFDELEAGLKVRLASTPTLVVIDGADGLESPEALFPKLGALAEPGRLLVTLRRQPAGAPMRVLPVEPLPRRSMDELLLEIAQLSGSKRLERSLTDETLAAIYEAVGGNPLAGRLVAGQLATLPLERTLARLGELKTEDHDSLFERLFEESWAAAGEDAQMAAVALLVLPDEGADWNDIRAISGLAPARLDGALDALAASSLAVAEEDSLRYVLPPLARRFVESYAQVEPWRGMLGRAVRAAEARLRPGPEEAGPAGLARAISLFRQEAGLGKLPDDLDRQIAGVAPAARRSGQWPAWRDLMIRLVEELRPTGVNRRGLARALAELGVAHRWLGELAQARAAFDEAVAVYGFAGDFVGQAEVLLEVGLLCQSSGEREAAFEAFGRAAEVIGRHKAAALYRRALNGLAGLALAAADPAAALSYLQAALAATDEPPDGQTLSNIGMAYLQLGDTAQALEYDQRALAVFGEEDDLPRLARAHIRLGMACHAAGQRGEAQDHLTRGLDLMRALGDALGQARALNNLGVVFSAGEQLDEALATWQEALALQTRLGDRMGMAYTHFNLADLLWRQGQADQAREAMETARVLADELSITELIAQIAGHPMNGG